MRSMVEGWRRIACDPTTAAPSTNPSVTARSRAAPEDGSYTSRRSPIRSANGEETVTLTPKL
jgi:hypothetical protein